MREITTKAPFAALTFALMTTACSGNHASSAQSSAAPTASANAAASAAVASNAMAAPGSGGGASLFNSNCSSCHGATGQGAPGAFPPLAGNPVVTGNAANVIHIVKDGLTGKIVVKGQTYDGQMPPWKTQLSNADIASILTFVRSSFGNKAGAITTAQVAAVK